MKTALLFSAVMLLTGLQGEGGSNQATLELPDVGLALSYPKAWQVTAIKKSHDFKVRIPIDGSSTAADLEIYNVGFDAEKDVWQLSQKGINDRMRREVIRQWEEEILGVPLLLTKVSYTDKSGPKILLTGLMYSRTPKKLMFRLEASPDDFDKAEFVWRETMQTFRTGAPLKPEDPTKKPDPNKPVQQSLPPISKPKSLDEKVEFVKPSVVVEATAAGRKVNIMIPTGWEGKVAEDGTIALTNAEVASQIKVALASTLDSDPPQRALFVASSKTLNDFQKVAKRDESVPAKNKAGAMTASVWRVGTTAQGDLYTCDATIANGDFYVVVAYRTTNAAKIGAERKAVETLLQSMTIEQAP